MLHQVKKRKRKIDALSKLKFNILDILSLHIKKG